MRIVGLDEFCEDAAGFLSREPPGQPVPAAAVEFVQPWLREVARSDGV
jgi:hypothetical protein